MAVVSLRSHLVEELTDLLDAETQLTKALPKMAGSATTAALKAAFGKHLQETRGHIVRLNKALQQLGEKPQRKTCEAMAGLLTEVDEMMSKTPAGALQDAVMITAAQKVEHYEMATYGTVRTYAQVLGESGVAQLLAQTLKEEKAADSKLTAIAERSVNRKAADEWRTQDEAQAEEGIVERSAVWVGSKLGAASRQLASGTRRAAASVGLAEDRPAAPQPATARSSRGKRRGRSRSKKRG